VKVARVVMFGWVEMVEWVGSADYGISCLVVIQCESSTSATPASTPGT
jgi:hypothetical protein